MKEPKEKNCLTALFTANVEDNNDDPLRMYSHVTKNYCSCLSTLYPGAYNSTWFVGRCAIKLNN